MSDVNSREQLKKDKMPLILMGAGLLALIIFFMVVFPTDRKTKADKPVTASEAESGHTELRRSEFEEMDKRLARLEAQGESLRQLVDRLDGLEKSAFSRMDHIEKVLEQLQTKVTVSKPAAPRSVNTAGKRNVPKKRTTVRYHQVQAGDTLYQISRSYGLSVDVLRRLNNLAPDAAIHPGQKLIVTPDK